MTTLTNNEANVLANLRAAVENTDTRADGAVWGTVYLDNVARDGRSDRSFNGILGSLTNKGLYVDAGECFGSVLMGDAPAVTELDAEQQALDNAVANLDQAAAEALLDAELFVPAEGEKLVQMLRRLAAGWTGTRKEFIDGAAARGINKHTAATQYQLGKAK